MKASYGEIKICELLDSLGISYIEEYSFPDLVSTSGRVLRFDFAVFDDCGELMALLEFDGEQHYKAKSKFNGNQGLQKQQYNDRKKNEYCARNGYRLVRIPYTDYNFINEEYILKALGF